MRVAVLGAGAMGAAVAIAIDRAGHEVALCGTEMDGLLVEAIVSNRHHPSLEYTVSERISVVPSAGWETALPGTDIAVVAVASAGVADVVRRAGAMLPAGCIWAIASKGWDNTTARPLSAVVADAEPPRPVVVMVGPTLAKEIAAGTPTAFVCACADASAAETVARAISSDTVRGFISTDVAGVEVGAALKNVLAIAIGMCDGIEESRGRAMTNAKAALFSRGLVEMSRLAVALGGKQETVLGLAGAGDLFVTVLGGRNGRFGRLVGTGLEPKKAFDEMGTTVEGYENVAEAVKLAAEHGVDMPTVHMVHSVLYEGADPYQAISALMGAGVEHEL